MDGRLAETLVVFHTERARSFHLPSKIRKPKPFRAAAAVKAAARQAIGTPPATRAVPSTKKPKAEKHKPTLGKLLRDAGE